MDIILRRRIEDVEIPLARITHFKHTGQVPAPVAVVRRTPYCDDGAVEHLLEAFHHKLMGSADKAEVVLVVEAFDNVGTEEESSASW